MRNTLRFATRQRALAELFAVSQNAISKTIRQTRPLLDLAGHPVQPTGITLADAEAVLQYTSDATETG